MKDDDSVFFQNGSMTDASSLGSMTSPPKRLTKSDSSGWALCEKLSEGRQHSGIPTTFNNCIAQSIWASFTVTVRNPAFFDRMNQLSGNEASTGESVTLKDSNWMVSSSPLSIQCGQPRWRFKDCSGSPARSHR